MSNPLFNMLNKSMPSGDIMQQFQLFMSRNQGIDPNEEINKMLKSGRITQQQYNQAQQMAQNMMRSMRGFMK